LAQESRAIDAEKARIERRYVALKVRSDAIRERQNANERTRARSKSEVQSLNRRIRETNRLVDEYNHDKNVFKDDVADLNRRIDSYNAKVRAAASAGKTGDGGGLYFYDNAPKRRR
jgi:chromosome segregation ATPase